MNLDGRPVNAIHDGRNKLALGDVQEVRKTRDGLLLRTSADIFVVDAALQVVD